MPSTPNAGIPYVPEGTLDPAAGLNLSLNVIDALLQPRVISMSLTSPPGSPTDGACYVPASPATGAWSGKEDWLARYVAQGDFWQFYEPGLHVSFLMNDDDGTFYTYDATSPSAGWVQVQGSGDGPNRIDIGIFFPGGPPSSNQLIGKFVAARSFEFPANFADSQGHIGTNPSSSFDIAVSVAGASAGTISVSTGGVFSFATTGGSAVPVAAGEVIEFEAPGSADGSAADIAFTLIGEIA